MLNRSHVATIWNLDPNYSLPNIMWNRRTLNRDNAVLFALNFLAIDCSNNITVQKSHGAYFYWPGGENSIWNGSLWGQKLLRHVCIPIGWTTDIQDEGSRAAFHQKLLRHLTKRLRGCKRTIYVSLRSTRPMCATHTISFTVIIGDLSIVRFCGHDCII